MKRLTTLCVLATLVLGASGCSHMNDQSQRALSGGAIGAAGGAAITALAGGSILGGALVGGAAGAVIGAVTSPGQVSVHR
jgi:osmotically inducible lipoprotein OsmB